MKKLLLLFILVFFFTVFGQNSPEVATFTVTNLNDSGAGSLRQAISDAGVMTGDDVINFQNGLTGSINLTSGELLINSNITISGNGGITITRSTATNTPYFRILNITSNATVAINNLTISGGNLSAKGALGGGIYNAGNLSISSVTISNNYAGCTRPDCAGDGTVSGLNGSGGGIYNVGVLAINGSNITSNFSGDKYAYYGDFEDVFGGGISNAGTLTIFYSNISNNLAQGSNVGSNGGGNAEGGGIYNTGTANITNSTISGNTAQALNSSGGGIYNSNTLNITGVTINNNLASQILLNTASTGAGGGILNLNQLNVTNSTISNNKSAGTQSSSSHQTGGGGIYAGGPTIIRNSTIGGNTQFTEGLGGGIQGSFQSSVIISNTIIAGNVDRSGNSDFKSVTPVQSEGNNLIGTVNNSSGWIASDILNKDPKLASLGNNGGFTQTQALLTGSPAINAGNNQNAPATDQRGFARIVGGIIDIGAYESDFVSATPTPSPSPTPNSTPTSTPTPSPTPNNCTYSIPQNSQTFTAAGGTGSIAVATSGGCTYSAFANDIFIVINSDGSNGGAVEFTVGQNTGMARTGRIYIGNLIFTVNQSAPKSRTRVKFF